MRTEPFLGSFFVWHVVELAWGENVYTVRRTRNKHRFGVFFLLFACLFIGMPLLIAFGLGNSDVTEVDISVKMPQESGSAPLLAIVGNGIFFNIPAHDEDYWRLQDNTLKLFFHNHDLSNLASQQGYLDQQVQFFFDDGLLIIEIEVDNLPPVFRVKKIPEGGYSVVWSEAGLGGKRIAIDPGHGGHDPGAIGYQIGLFEKDVTLAIALELEKLLIESGAEVFLTRSTDTLVDTTLEPGKHIRPDLWMRRDIVADWDPDFFVSIHNNSFADRNVGGIETFYNSTSFTSPQSKRAASLVQARLVEIIQRKDRGIRYKPSSDAVLLTDNYPSILAEILYISNRVEEAILADPGFAQKAAEALFQGISDYFDYGGE